MYNERQMTIIGNFKAKGYVVKERICDTHAEIFAIVGGEEKLLFTYSAEEAINTLLSISTKKSA